MNAKRQHSVPTFTPKRVHQMLTFGRFVGTQHRRLSVNLSCLSVPACHSVADSEPSR